MKFDVERPITWERDNLPEGYGWYAVRWDDQHEPVEFHLFNPKGVNLTVELQGVALTV